MVLGDRVALRRVVWNLVDDALNYGRVAHVGIATTEQHEISDTSGARFTVTLPIFRARWPRCPVGRNAAMYSWTFSEGQNKNRNVTCSFVMFY